MKHLFTVAVLLLVACGEPPPDEDVRAAHMGPVETETNTFAISRAETLPASGCSQSTSGVAIIREAHELMNRIRREQGTEYRLDPLTGRPPAAGQNPDQGLPCLAYQESLASAALGHGRYVGEHLGEPTGCIPAGPGGIHREVQGCNGFRGVHFGERLLAAGLGWPYQPIFEIGYTDERSRFASATGHQTAIDDWLHSVYHRLPLIDSLARAAGFGQADWFRAGGFTRTRSQWTEFAKFDPAVTIDNAHTRWVSRWPRPGATGIRRGYDACAESPSPPHPDGCIIGLAPSLIFNQFTPQHFGTANGVGRMFKYTFDGFVQIPTVYMDVHTDPAHLLQWGEFFVVPRTMLEPNQRYLVQFIGNLWSGVAFASNSTVATVEWSFTTGDI